MRTEAVVAVAGVAAFVAAAVVWVVAGWVATSRRETVQSLPSEEPDQQLHHSRLADGGQTCFRCRVAPAAAGHLWCCCCEHEIHELDAADTRTLEEK